jgi:hypothetical protein
LSFEKVSSSRFNIVFLQSSEPLFVSTLRSRKSEEQEVKVTDRGSVEEEGSDDWVVVQGRKESLNSYLSWSNERKLIRLSKFSLKVDFGESQLESAQINGGLRKLWNRTGEFVEHFFFQFLSHVICPFF